MRYLVLCLALFLELSPAFFSEANAAETGGSSQAASYESYVAQVAAAEKESEGAVSPYAFLVMESFEEIADVNNRSTDFAVRFLSERGHSSRQRLIVILSMYKLGVDDYAKFIPKMVELRDQNLMSPEELERSVLPRLSGLVLEHYAERGVQETLRAIVVRDDIRPQIKSSIRSILSGEALAARRRFDRANGLR